MKKLVGITLLLTSLGVSAEAVQWSKGFTATCVNPTERTDGTTLPLAEIATIEYHLDKVEGNITNPELTVIMAGGCKPTFIDTKLIGTGLYYRYAVTKDTDGRLSVASISNPITIQKANPKPPTNIK